MSKKNKFNKHSFHDKRKVNDEFDFNNPYSSYYDSEQDSETGFSKYIDDVEYMYFTREIIREKGIIKIDTDGSPKIKRQSERSMESFDNFDDFFHDFFKH